jgi:hypothetical protein
LTQDQDFTPKQLTLFPVPTEPTLPPDMEIVGRIGEYYVLLNADKKESIYYIFNDGTPIAYIALIAPTAPFGDGYPVTNPDLKGVGKRVIAVYISEQARGKNLSVQLYKWLLDNACDYLLPDDLQTRGGVYIWKQLVKDPRFDVFIFNPDKYDYYPAKSGAVWSNVYKSYRLRPFVTLAGKADDLIER